MALRRWRGVLTTLPLGFALAFYAWVQVLNFTPGTVEDDCEGYMILGKRLAHGEAVGVVEPDPFVFQSHVWVKNARGELLPKYAPGFPWLLGLASRLGGDNAMFAVSPLCGALALVGAWGLFRHWMRPIAAGLATMVLASNPTFLDYAAYPLAHVPEMALSLLGLWALWRWLRRPLSWGAAVGAGLLLGGACAIRHTAILQGAAAGVAVCSVLGTNRAAWRAPGWRALTLGLAFALCPLAMAAYQWRWFGSPEASGYALSGEQTALGWGYACANFAKLNRAMGLELAYFVAPLGLVGLVAVGPWRERTMRLMAFFGTYLVYLAYYWAPPSMAYYRFLLPTVPLLVGGAFLLVDSAIATRGGRALALATVTLICFAHHGPLLLHKALAGRLTVVRGENHAAAAREIAPFLAEDAVLFLREPLARGMGAFRRYRPVALDAFQPWRIAREMPPWVDPLSPEGRHYVHGPGWPIRAQEARRLELTALYEELGREGLALRRPALARDGLARGRDVAVLVPRGEAPEAVRRFSPLAATELHTFSTPSAGEWTLLRLAIPLPDRSGP